jgi:hypothetical protein
LSRRPMYSWTLLTKTFVPGRTGTFEAHRPRLGHKNAWSRCPTFGTQGAARPPGHGSAFGGRATGATIRPRRGVASLGLRGRATPKVRQWRRRRKEEIF